MLAPDIIPSNTGIKLVDYLTFTALILGPALAVGIQLWFEKRREDRRRKSRILDALMSNRARNVSLEFVQALNLIDIVWYEHTDVREKWKQLFAEFERGRGLISLMAKKLGYQFDHTLLKQQNYNPQAAADEDLYQAAVRRAMLPLVSGERPLLIKITEDHIAPSAIPPAPSPMMPPLTDVISTKPK
jgi:hypothetical protein